MEKFFAGLYRVLVIVLLSSILFVQIKLLKSVPPSPPTFGDLKKITNAEQRKEMMLKRPLVVVDGSVGIDGSVDISGTVDVEVQNTFLPVEIVR